MPTAVRETIQVLEMIVQAVPVGTNLGLLYMLWAMLSGSFLKSRGAVFPALQESGLDEQQMRRSWAAMRYGKWAIETLIEVFRRHVQAERKWEGHQYEGYRPVAVDWTAFWRPQLQGWEGKMYHGLAQRALPGVGFGVVVDVGQVGEQRVPLLRHVLRIEGEDRERLQVDIGGQHQGVLIERIEEDPDVEGLTLRVDLVVGQDQVLPGVNLNHTSLPGET